eukprot:m.118198 g.118198  ORF g.118198 m.118198 type:complete len:257 (+) comp13648_c0_seq1:161-931(+)
MSSPDGLLVSGTQGGACHVWSMHRVEAPLATFRPHSGPVNCARWNHTNKVIATCSANGRLVLSSTTGTPLNLNIDQRSIPEIPLKALAFSGDSKLIAVGGEAATLYLWNLRTKQLQAELHGQGQRIASIAFDATSSTLAFGDVAGNVTLYSIASDGNGKSQLLAALDAPGGGVTSLEFSRKRSALLAIGFSTGHVVVWDCAKGAEYCRFRPSTAPGTISSCLDKGLCHTANVETNALPLRFLPFLSFVTFMFVLIS